MVEKELEKTSQACLLCRNIGSGALRTGQERRSVQFAGGCRAPIYLRDHRCFAAANTI